MYTLTAFAALSTRWWASVVLAVLDAGYADIGGRPVYADGWRYA